MGAVRGRNGISFRSFALVLDGHGFTRHPGHSVGVPPAGGVPRLVGSNMAVRRDAPPAVARRPRSRSGEVWRSFCSSRAIGTFQGACRRSLAPRRGSGFCGTWCLEIANPGKCAAFLTVSIRGSKRGATRNSRCIPVSGNRPPFPLVPDCRTVRNATSLPAGPGRPVACRRGPHVCRKRGMSSSTSCSRPQHSIIGAFYHRRRFDQAGHWIETGGTLGWAKRTDPLVRVWRFSDRVRKEWSDIKTRRGPAGTIIRSQIPSIVQQDHAAPAAAP